MVLKSIRCECGVGFQADDEQELVARAQRHARDVHHMDLTREQVLAMAEPVVATDSGRPARRPKQRRPTRRRKERK